MARFLIQKAVFGLASTDTYEVIICYLNYYLTKGKILSFTCHNNAVKKKIT